MSFHARCEKCGVYAPAPVTIDRPWPRLPEKWNRIAMGDDTPNVGVFQSVVLCPPCSGDVWGSVAAQLKFRELAR